MSADTEPGELQRGSRLGLETLLERITDRDLALLCELDELRLATTRHLQQLHFELAAHRTLGAATRACVRVLTRLRVLGLVANLPRRIGGARAGSAGYIWQLGSSGERLLRALRGDPKRRRLGHTSAMFVQHTLTITELVVELREYVATAAHLRLEILTEPSCWQTYLGAHGQRETLRPDLLVVATGTEFVDHTFVEVDRATEHLPTVLRKCHAYTRYAVAGAYQDLHDVFPSVLWVVPSQARADAVREAIDGDPRLANGAFAVTTAAAALDRLVPDEPPRSSEPAAGGSDIPP